METPYFLQYEVPISTSFPQMGDHASIHRHWQDF
jgi:hypothetical protein